MGIKRFDDEDRSLTEKYVAASKRPGAILKATSIYATGLLFLALLVGAGIYFLHSKTGHDAVSSITGSHKSGSSASGGSPKPAPQPGQVDDIHAAPTITPEDRKVGAQLMNLYLAVEACEYSSPVIPMSAQQTADYCNDPEHLETETVCQGYCGTGSTSTKPHEGFTWGTGSDQVESKMSVQTTSQQVAHHVTFPDGHTQTIYNTKSDDNLIATLTGKTADGSELTMTVPGSTFILDSDSNVLFWVDTGLLPPCAGMPDGQACMVQPTDFDSKTQAVTDWTGPVTYSWPKG